MEKNRRNWGGWLLIMLCALFAVTYLWRNWDHNKEAAKPVNEVATHASANPVQPASLTPTIATHPTITADGMAAVPMRLQLANVSRVRTARSFQEWLARFPTDQQAKITAFNKAHFGVYRVNSREQVAWMAANGYLMPEDIVAAERLSDRDLLKLAEQGNDKAAFVLAERQNKELVAFLAGGGDKQTYYYGTGSGNRAAEGMTIERLIKQSNSPYKGYLQANEAVSGLYAGQGQGVIDVRVIAGLEWAMHLGDLRAGQFMTDYVGGDPQRSMIADTAAVVSLNAAESMAFMERTGGQRAVAAGGGIPGGFEPVH